MIDFNAFEHDASAFMEPEHLQQISAALQNVLNKKNGNVERWLPVIENLPNIQPSHIDLNSDTITIGSTDDCDVKTRLQLENDLRKLSPWRKGPFSLFDIFIDTEWRSDWKWQRVAPHLSSLKNRRILDVGCGSGYHLWRMLGAGASSVIGIDPSLLFLMQFRAMKHFIGDCPVHLLPLGIEHMPEEMPVFDTVFSMGVLYHRRSPIDHILQLKSCLRPGGELVLETLVIDENYGDALVPKDRYAKMRNVWFIPSCTQLALWLERCGMADIKLADVSQTSVEEQRATEWMQFESLSDFLDPDDRDKTIEGYPAPKRATFIALKP